MNIAQHPFLCCHSVMSLLVAVSSHLLLVACLDRFIHLGMSTLPGVGKKSYYVTLPPHSSGSGAYRF